MKKLSVKLMQNKHCLLLLLCFFCVAHVFGQDAVNDHMFPAREVARPFIDFDNKGFLIGGKRTFLVSAGMEYARVPHQLWYDRLLRLKRGGFNCVEIYTIWNFHEPTEGKFEFSGDQDLDLFLSLVKKMDMYAIVRVGPYYCAEWDHGGYPIWLRFKKGLRVREDNPVFERYVDRYFDHLLPIVFKHQINKGGSVILVQLENEHPKGWGTAMPNNYFKRLQSKSLSLGLQVPYFFSGVHHASDPAGKGSLDDPLRPNPWFSTEFWSVWYSQYGAKPTDAGLYDRRTWKVIAHGGNGYNFYMAHGGSNFGYTNNDEDAASYDYGAAVGQAGDLRPIYYTFKRAGFFARSFQDILENSTDGSKSYQAINADTALKITARTGKAGDLIFIDNPGKKSLTAEIKINRTTPAVKINLDSGEIYPLVHNFELNRTVKLNWALTRIYSIIKQNNTTTIVVEAKGGDQVYLQFLVKGKAVVTAGRAGFKITGNRIDFTGSAGVKSIEHSFTVGKTHVRLLIMNRKGTDHTWIGGGNAIITGVSYLGKTEIKQGHINAAAEYSLDAQPDGLAHIYLEKSSKLMVNKKPGQVFHQPLVKLSAWETKDASASAAVNYDDKKWLSSSSSLQMGADGDLTADAWYRVKFKAPVTGKYTLQVDGGDRATAFIDGKPAAKWKIRDGEVLFDMKQGKHTLAIFTAHNGRDKMAAYLGPIDNLDKKGLSGNALLKNGGPFISTLDHWYFVRTKAAIEVKDGPPVLDTLRAEKYKIGADAFGLKEGFGWFQTVIPAQPGLSKLIVSFKSVDENATVFINGKEMMHREGWNIPFELAITDAKILKKPMVLSLFIENYSNEGGIDQPVKINTIGEAQVLKGWKMHGGIDSNAGMAGWTELNDHDVLAHKTGMLLGPAFFRSHFSVPVINGQQMIWRVNTKGLSHGSVWINGHNLGRYPEVIGAIGLYVPEPWLKTGENELLIYEEEGNTPHQVSISLERAASRVSYKLTSK